MISKLINRKEYMLNLLYNYIDEKNSFYNLLLEKLNFLSKLSQDKLSKIETAINIQEKNKFSNTDQINFISSLELDKIEDNDLNIVLNEIKSGYIPTILYDKNENIEGFAEAVINYLTLNIENMNNYSDYNNTINSKIKKININNNSSDNRNEKENSMNIDNNENENDNYNLFQNENDIKKLNTNKKLNHFFNNKIQELSSSFAK